MSRSLTFLVTFVLCAAANAAAWALEISAMSTPPTETQIRDVITDKLNGPYADVGIVVGVIDGRNELVVTQGYTDKSKRHAVSAETLFEIGDLTKVFTGLLMADMIKRAEVKPEDHVSKYLPDGLAFTNGAQRGTQLVDLATSSAGSFWNLPRVSVLHRDALVTDLSWQADGITPVENTVIANRPYLFSDLGFGILGHALAKRHKSSYRQILTERLLRPLALENTYVGSSQIAPERIAQGHDANMNSIPSHAHLTMFAASDGVSSTTIDMMKFLEAVVQHQYTRFAFAHRKSLSVRRATIRPEYLSAMGWAILQYEGRDLLWRGSDVDGFSAWMGIDHASKRAIVVMANVGTAVATEIGFRLLIPDAAANDSASRVKLKPERLQAMAGGYRLTDGSLLSIAHVGEVLTLSLNGKPGKPAYPISDRRFISIEAGMTFTFDYENEEAPHPLRVVFYQDNAVEVAERIEGQD